MYGEHTFEETANGLKLTTNWLTLQKQDVTQILLSSHPKIDPMITSTVLRTLQARGLLQRQEHLTDTRAKTVGLTESGKKIIKQAIKTIEIFDKSFLLHLLTKHRHLMNNDELYTDRKNKNGR